MKGSGYESAWKTRCRAIENALAEFEKAYSGEADDSCMSGDLVRHLNELVQKHIEESLRSSLRKF